MLFGQNIIIGFEGTHPNDRTVMEVSRLIEAGAIGGLIFFKYNILSPIQVRALTRHFHSLSAPHPLFLSVDQEGGRVERLSTSNGFKSHRSAFQIASLRDVEAAKVHYISMAEMVREAGFNLVFGPVVDHHDAACPIIGQYQRAYGSETAEITPYAEAFVESFRRLGILTCIKHFPGHGSSRADSHAGFVDVTDHWTADELIPFKAMITTGHADMVMTAHVWHKNVDQADPASLSGAWIREKLRTQLAYNGVVITDDLYMGAIMNHAPLKDAVARSFLAGGDIALLSMNAAARLNAEGRRETTLNLEDIRHHLEQLVDAGVLPLSLIEASALRVLSLKSFFSKYPQAVMPDCQKQFDL
ncbi:MAG: glycoside hydrolase family 3 N-terminal domain-containing protein [Candidatus Nucleicultricaceae bacterium]|jgi:beta-N-acetylhexosaminidase